MKSNVYVDILRLFTGFIIIAFGIELMRRANLGLNPWGIFHSGIALATGISFGRAAQLTGLVLIILSSLYRYYPGIGTILNMMFIGYFVDLIHSFELMMTVEDSFLVSLFVLLLGNIVFSFGIYFYLTARLGAGPRDGVMLALMKITGKGPEIIKTSLEAFVLITGFLLGGDLGIGTVILALTGGVILRFIFRIKGYTQEKYHQRDMMEFISNFKADS